jgi:hypothetical protein
MDKIRSAHEISCSGEKGFLNQILMFNKTRIKTLSKAKNLTMPWYLLYLTDKNQEKRMIKIVPVMTTIRFIL